MNLELSLTRSLIYRITILREYDHRKSKITVPRE